MSSIARTVRALDTILAAAMDDADGIAARHAFRLCQREARTAASTTNDSAALSALRNIDAIASMGLA
jgi:hypothetical protein